MVEGDQLETVYEAPALLVKRVVVFPHMEMGVTVREPRDLAALRTAMEEHHLVVHVSASDVESLVGAVGTLVLVQKNLLTPRSAMQTLLRGLSRVRIEGVEQGAECTRVRFRRLEEADLPGDESVTKQKVLAQIDEFVKLIPGIPNEIITLLRNTESPSQLADLCAYSPEFTYEERLDLLGTLDPEERLQKVSRLFEKQLEALKGVMDADMIPECETCAELAEKAFDSNSEDVGRVISMFLSHVVRDHTGELLALLAEKYGPIFMMKRALR
jgi:ATP-dependent Lon protease